MQEFKNVNIFSKLDLTNSYWQVPLHESSHRYTAFLFQFTMYQFKRVPFGLKTAGSAFIRLLKNALSRSSPKLLKCLRYYIDDMLIANESIEEQFEALDELFSIMRQFNFTLNLIKCEFFKRKTKFLGFIMSEKGIVPNPENLESIQNFEEPRDQNQLQQLFGTCNYYRRFNPEYNKFVIIFRDLLKKNAIWQWTSQFSEAFHALKKSFINTVCLGYIIPGATFIVQTDACDYGIAGVIYQIDEIGDERIISIVSRCLTNAEINYTTTEKELLAIVYTIMKCRYYLIGVHFEIKTDHKGLTFLNSTQYHNSRLMRWSLLLQQYSFSVTHCRGVDNKVADFFSRNPEGRFWEERNDSLKILSLQYFQLPVITENQSTILEIMALQNENTSLKIILKNLKTKQYEDSKLENIIDQCRNNENMESYQVLNEVLFHRKNETDNWCIVVPEIIKQSLMISLHEKLGHPGLFKTFSYISRYYVWKNMYKNIKHFVLSCDLCQRVKHPTVAMEGEYNLVASEGPSDLVTVDYYGPLPRGRGGVEYLFVMLDAFSKLVRLYPMRRATAMMSLKKVLDNYIPECGKPRRILSDNGTQFTSPRWRARLEGEGIRVVFSSVCHPQSNPTERVMREINRLLRTFCQSNHTSWPNHIKKVEHLLNITTHYSTGCSPHELHFGESIRDDVEKLIKFPERQGLNREYMLT